MKVEERDAAAVWACVLVVLACGLAGCRTTVPGAFGGRDISWGHLEVGKEAVPGIDIATVHVGVWGDGAAIVVWSDGTGGSFGGGGMGSAQLQPGETRQGVKYCGSLASQDGRLVNVECYTPDGKVGTVRIGGESYELARGGLFLVSMSGAEPKVKQLGLAKLDLKPEGSRTLDDLNQQALEELTIRDPEIHAFFAEAAKSE